MAKSLHCPSETLTILLIDYIPIQKVKKSFKRARSQPFPLFATSSYERSVFKCLPTERTFLKSWQNGAGRGGRAPCSTQKQQNGLPPRQGSQDPESRHSFGMRVSASPEGEGWWHTPALPDSHSQCYLSATTLSVTNTCPHVTIN